MNPQVEFKNDASTVPVARTLSNAPSIRMLSVELWTLNDGFEDAVDTYDTLLIASDVRVVVSCAASMDAVGRLEMDSSSFANRDRYSFTTSDRTVSCSSRPLEIEVNNVAARNEYSPVLVHCETFFKFNLPFPNIVL